MTRDTVLKSVSTNTRKRKSTGDIDNETTKPYKQSRKTLESFFSPQVLASGCPKNEASTHDSVTLNKEQNEVLRMVCDEGKNVFFTGSAGTGKSLLLRAIISALRKKHAKKPDIVSVTASTGMAASNIGGMTIHSWGAVTPGLTDIERQISCIKTCKPAHKRWKSTKILVIDEVSMVDGHLFEILATLASRLRKKTDKPFGGIQLVITGDFFQLPPVTKGGNPFFAFECDAWKASIERTVNLTQVFRQKDSHFVDLLNEMRHGTISPAATNTFKSLSRPLTPPPGLLPTELFPLRSEVDRANAARLSALPSPMRAYIARDSGSAKPDKRAKLLENMVVPQKLELKMDAQVMLVKNVDETLVNGSVGRVLGFFPVTACAPSSSASPSKPDSTGGQSKPRSSIGLQESKNGGIRNVQVESDGRTPVGFVQGKENKPRPSKETGKGKGKEKEDESYPLVEFRTPQGTEIVLLVRDEFRVEDNEGNLLARRVQVPLALAWAMSIHKSQGQTIQLVKIDLGKVFEKGQSYVALSRAATLDGLQVLRFDPKKVMAHYKVIEWSKSLETTSI